MKPREAKFICDKCGIRGISLDLPHAPPKCHICNYEVTMRKADEPEYSHGKKK
jgi:hypothetical protein